MKLAVGHDRVYPAVGATEAACIVAPNYYRAKALNTGNLLLIPIAYGNKALDSAYRTNMKCHGDSRMLPGDSAPAPQ